MHLVRTSLCLAILLLAPGTRAPAAAPPLRPLGKLTWAQGAWLKLTSSRLTSLVEAGRFAEAEKRAREVVALRERAQGRLHWETRDARLEMERWGRLSRVPPDRRQVLV
jgi:hypothetical protein